MTSLSAKEVTIDGDDVIMPTGNWVDFGTISLTLNLLLDSPTGGAAAGGGGGVFSQEEGNFNGSQDGFGSQSQPDELEGTIHEPAPAIEEIFYADMTGTDLKVLPNGTATMTISVPELSKDIMGAGYGSRSPSGDTHRIMITLETKDLENMRVKAEVAKAMEKAGFSLMSGGGAAGGGNGNALGALGGGEPDTSQRPKKVSM